jgi:monoamine oxidase
LKVIWINSKSPDGSKNLLLQVYTQNTVWIFPSNRLSIFLSLFDPGDANEYKLYGESDERYSITGGNQKLCDVIAKELESQLLKDHMLTAIAQNESKQYMLTFKVGGAGEIGATADMVLLAIPFTLPTRGRHQGAAARLENECNKKSRLRNQFEIVCGS